MAFADHRDFLVDVALDLLALEEKIGPLFVPLLGFVERVLRHGSGSAELFGNDG